MDIDDILRAQGSDEESDEDETVKDGILGTEAFDRRLEEILNAEAEDDEDSDGAGKASSSNPFNARRSELVSYPLGEGAGAFEAVDVSPVNSFSEHEDLASSQGSMPVATHREMGSLSAHKESTRSLLYESYKDDSKVSSQLSKEVSVSTAEKLFPSQRDAKVLDSSSSGNLHWNAEEELSSKTWPLPTTQVSVSPSLPSREFGSFSSVATSKNRISTTIRPETALTEADAASTSIRTPQLSDLVQQGLVQDQDFSRNDSLEVPSAVDTSAPAEQIDDVSNAYSESALQSHSAVHIIPNSFTSIEGKSIHPAQIAESEDDSSLLDDDKGDAFDAESQSADKSFTISSDDDSEQEEIKSILSRELLVSEAEITSPAHTSASENGPFGVVSKGNLTEPQSSALDKAEEAEKKAALSGFGIEEGAASQPMRLTGLQTGPPSIGYVRLDVLNSVSQILSLATTTRENGTAQAITMCGHNLAVGLSKGSVFLLSLKSNGGKFADVVDKCGQVTCISY
ncbi:hypothetical protein GOP47_0001107, partial [Adiantum capillus-veneris]